MARPPRFVHPQLPNHVCKLKKYLYGLKPVPRAWFKDSTFLLHVGFTCSIYDPSLFILKHDFVLILKLVYVDDIILTRNSTAHIKKTL